MLIAKILNHKWADKGSTSVYNRWEKLPEMRLALERWSSRLEQIAAGRLEQIAAGGAGQGSEDSMKEKPVKLDPYLMNHFSLWLPKMFAPIYRRAREIGEKALREAQDARSGKVPSAVNVAINDRRTISDTALCKESTDIFCSHYAHLFIGDFSAWNDLASESPSPLDYLLPRVTELIPQSPLSSDELPRFEALTELSDSEKEVMERQVWPDRKVAERELQDWAHLYTENWENDQSRKEGFQKAEKKWQERNEDLFVGSWWGSYLRLPGNLHRSNGLGAGVQAESPFPRIETSSCASRAGASRANGERRSRRGFR